MRDTYWVAKRKPRPEITEGATEMPIAKKPATPLLSQEHTSYGTMPTTSTTPATTTTVAPAPHGALNKVMALGISFKKHFKFGSAPNQSITTATSAASYQQPTTAASQTLSPLTRSVRGSVKRPNS